MRVCRTTSCRVVVRPGTDTDTDTVPHRYRRRPRTDGYIARRSLPRPADIFGPQPMAVEGSHASDTTMFFQRSLPSCSLSLLRAAPTLPVSFCGSWDVCWWLMADGGVAPCCLPRFSVARRSGIRWRFGDSATRLAPTPLFVLRRIPFFCRPPLSFPATDSYLYR